MSDNKTLISVEELHKEYNRILERLMNNELSHVHAQGALAYLELKALDSNIVFISPVLNHASKDYKSVEGIPANLIDPPSSSDEYSEDVSEQSDMFPDDYTDETHVTPTPDPVVGEENSDK
jgi:hypothetical protein